MVLRLSASRIIRSLRDSALSRTKPIRMRAQEFPRVDERRVGRRHRYGYAPAVGRGPEQGGALLKHDLQRGTTTTREFGPGKEVGEFAPDAAEDDGKGPAAVQARRLAREVGASTMSVYHYFGDRLVEAAVRLLAEAYTALIVISVLAMRGRRVDVGRGSRRETCGR